jgi:hypothetical protein
MSDDAPSCFVGDPFSLDIFVSYSHGDVDGSGDSKLKQWSRAFWRELEREMPLHERNVKVFFDQSTRLGVPRFVDLDPQLQQALRGSALFLVLMSKFQAASEYCQKERDWWVEGQKAQGFDIRNRVAPIVIWGQLPEGAKSWDEFIKGQGYGNPVGVYLFDRADPDTFPQPFGWPGTDDRINDARFDKELPVIIAELRNRLREFRHFVAQRRAAEESNASKWSGGKPSIYLHGQADDAANWNRAYRMLDDAGYTVWPDQPEKRTEDPDQRKLLRDKRIESLARSDALFMVAPEDSHIFRSEFETLCLSERNAAIDLAAKAPISRVGKHLPGAVIDTVADEERAQRRMSAVVKSRCGWFHIRKPDWVTEAAAWLGAAP